MSNKLPFKISSEDLLNALNEASDAPLEEVAYTTDIPVFLSKFKFETGEYNIRPLLLYRLYRLFSEQPVNPRKFSLEVANFIMRNDNYFKMNIKPQQILKILNPQVNANKLSSFSVKKHYDTFLEKTKITKGTRWLEGFLLYEVYRFYCIDNKIHKLLIHEDFVAISKLHFEYKRIGTSKGIQFKLNINVLDVLTEEHIQRIKNGRLKDEKFKEARRGKGKKRKKQG